MKVDIIDVFPLESVPSASGIAVRGDMIYAIGDDSPFLHQLDKRLQSISTWPIFKQESMEDGRILKAAKADLEAMELVSDGELVIFGSGSRSPVRDVYIRFRLDGNPSFDIYMITEFYSYLKELPVMQFSELNIEAAAFYQGSMLLFNRLSPVIFEFDHAAFVNYLDRLGPMPDITAWGIELPALEGVASGFSGATISSQTGRLIVTVSVENMNNAYDDGPVIGSLVGCVPWEQRERAENYQFVDLPRIGQRLKVESVAIEKQVSQNELIVLMTTDNDGGVSQLIRARLMC